jgi:hypothetical protein
MRNARYTTSKTAALYGHERTAVVVATAFFVMSFALYMYFLSASIVNVVMRQEIDLEIRTTNARIAELEARYSAAKNAVGIEQASTYGFINTTSKTYVSRKGENVVLSTNDEG